MVSLRTGGCIEGFRTDGRWVVVAVRWKCRELCLYSSVDFWIWLYCNSFSHFIHLIGWQYFCSNLPPKPLSTDIFS